MAELHVVDKLLNALSALHTEIHLYDEKGEAIPAGASRRLPVFSQEERIVVFDGYAWCRVQAAPIAYVTALGTDARAVDCARLAATLAEAYNVEPAMHGKLDVFRGVLRDELSGPELATLASEYGIPMNQERCVILFYGTKVSLEDLLPMENGDTLIEVDRHTTVLVKSMRDIADVDELQQLAEAMEQTIMSETGERPMIGIGEIKGSLDALGLSYRSARRALEIGRVFRPESNIFTYDRMILERYLSEMPPEVGMRYHQILFNRRNQRLFNEEMLHTIEMFFEKDLNLSDTARQLYIHRNTLVYRLDKIQKQTGLDLRHFDDAITFCLLLKLGKCGSGKLGDIR